MPISFLQLWENMGGDALQTSGDADSRQMEAIRAGVAITPQPGGFWDAFVQVCNNTEGMSELLEVRPEQFSRFTAKIRALAQQAKDNPPGRDRKAVLPTGLGDTTNQEQP